MITLVCVFLGIAFVILSPFLLILGIVALLFPIYLLLRVLCAIINILLWKPKHPMDDDESDIKQVNQNERKVYP